MRQATSRPRRRRARPPRASEGLRVGCCCTVQVMVAVVQHLVAPRGRGLCWAGMSAGGAGGRSVALTCVIEWMLCLACVSAW